MSTPNDAAVLHAIFNPAIPFGDVNEPEEELPSDQESDGGLPDVLKEEARNLELLGVKAAESGDLNTALQNFNKAIALLPDHASAYNNRAQALRLQGNLTGALKDLNRAVELSRGKGVAGCQALVQRGLIMRLQGNDEEARNDFKRAADQGSGFAKQQLILLNPYAALCNSMLKDMIQKLYGTDVPEC